MRVKEKIVVIFHECFDGKIHPALIGGLCETVKYRNYNKICAAFDLVAENHPESWKYISEALEIVFYLPKNPYLSKDLYRFLREYPIAASLGTACLLSNGVLTCPNREYLPGKDDGTWSEHFEKAFTDAFGSDF